MKVKSAEKLEEFLYLINFRNKIFAFYICLFWLKIEFEFL